MTPTLTEVFSFGFRYGKPDDRGITIVDVRQWRNPYRDRKLRYLTGEHSAVITEVLSTPGVSAFIDSIVANPPSRIALGCTAGRHRSVVIANEIARRLGIMALHRE